MRDIKVNILKGQMTNTFFFAENLKFGRFRCQLETLKNFFDLTFCLRENAIFKLFKNN